MIHWLRHSESEILQWDECTALHLAVEYGRYDLLLPLLKMGMRLEDKDCLGLTALGFTVYLGGWIMRSKAHRQSGLFLAMIQLFLECGAKVDCRDLRLDTPLHMAVRNGNVELVRLLLRSGANIDAQNREGYTPLHLAVIHQHVWLVQYLGQRGADISILDNYDRSPLRLARERHSEAIIIRYLATME